MAASPAAQRLVARTVLSLPTPILRLMAGGGVVHKGGRTLDPRLQFLAAQAKGAPPMETLSPEEARRGEAALVTLSGDLEPGVRWEPLTVPGGDGEIAARLYTPRQIMEGNPLVVWAHMGGGVIGSLETGHTFCSLLARIAEAPVLSVDYRLAPEHRFPAGFEDVLAAFRWARENADRFGARGAAIGGDSMGGAFAAAVCQELKRTGERQPVGQLLIYPCTDVASETPSMTTYGDAFPLTRPMMDWFMGHYLGPDADPNDPRVSPLRSSDFSGLAPAVVATAGFDPLVDQGEAYAKALSAAGVPTAYRRYDSLCHAFTAFTGAVPEADRACREVSRLLYDVFNENYEAREPA
jgi:acetyl esterase